MVKHSYQRHQAIAFGSVETASFCPPRQRRGRPENSTGDIRTASAPGSLSDQVTRKEGLDAQPHVVSSRETANAVLPKYPHGFMGRLIFNTHVSDTYKPGGRSKEFVDKGTPAEYSASFSSPCVSINDAKPVIEYVNLRLQWQHSCPQH